MFIYHTNDEVDLWRLLSNKNEFRITKLYLKHLFTITYYFQIPEVLVKSEE